MQSSKISEWKVHNIIRSCFVLVLILLPLFQTIAIFQHYSGVEAFSTNSSNDPKLGNFTSPNPSNDGYFGTAIALDKGVIAIGAPGEKQNGVPSAGRVYVFNASSQGLIANLTNPSPVESDEFGSSITLNGNIVAVGESEQNEKNIAGAGSVDMYYINGTLISSLFSPNAQTYGFFGEALTLHSTLLAVGAPGENQSEGKVYLFNTTNNQLIRTINNPNNTRNDDGFGSSLAVNDGIIAISAPRQYPVSHVYLFNESSGVLLYSLNESSSSFGDGFGYYISIDSNMIAVGTQENDVYLFNAPNYKLYKIVKNPSEYSNTGSTSSIMIYGDALVVGVSSNNVQSCSDAGIVYEFNVTNGKLLNIIISPQPTTQGEFGATVALDNDTIFVGAPQESGLQFREGLVYSFPRSNLTIEPMTITQTQTLCQTTGLSANTSTSSYHSTSVEIFSSSIATATKTTKSSVVGLTPLLSNEEFGVLIVVVIGGLVLAMISLRKKHQIDH